jgi:hypothetical protein
LLLYQIVILLLKNPNTIRTFSAAFSQKALCSGFQTNAERQLCARCRHRWRCSAHPKADIHSSAEATGSQLTNSLATVTRNDPAAQTEPFGVDRKNDNRIILSTKIIEFKNW